MDGKNFRDLKVWQLGMRLAEDVYRLSRRFPKTGNLAGFEEKYQKQVKERDV